MKKIIFIAVMVFLYQAANAQYVNSQGVTINHYEGPAQGPTHDKPAGDKRPLAKQYQNNNSTNNNSDNSTPVSPPSHNYSGGIFDSYEVSPEKQHYLDSVNEIYHERMERESKQRSGDNINGSFENEVNANNSFRTVFEDKMKYYFFRYPYSPDDVNIIATDDALQNYLAKMHYPADTIQSGPFPFTDMQKIVGESCNHTGDYKRSVAFYSNFFYLNLTNPFLNKDTAMRAYIIMAESYTSLYKQEPTERRYIDSAIVCYQSAKKNYYSSDFTYNEWMAKVELQRGLLFITKEDYVAAETIFTEQINKREDKETLELNKHLNIPITYNPFYYYRAICYFNLKKNKKASADCKSSIKYNEIIEKDKITALQEQIKNS